MKLSTFGFLTGRGLRNLGTHWAMTIACVASLAVCMSLNTLASLVEVNVDSMVGYLGRQNETVVFLDPACDDETAAAVGQQNFGHQRGDQRQLYVQAGRAEHLRELHGGICGPLG